MSDLKTIPVLGINFNSTVENWAHAYVWLKEVNALQGNGEKDDGYPQTVPRWSWDCNFKLDYDGPLSDLFVNSRFYVDRHGWQGCVTVTSGFLERPLEKEFVATRLDILVTEVSAFVDRCRERIRMATQGCLVELFANAKDV